MKLSTIAPAIVVGLLALSIVPGLAHATDPVASIALTPATQTLAFGTTLQLVATAYNSTGAPLDVQPTFSWATDLGTVSASGLFTATRVGTAHVTASVPGFTATSTITVPGHPRLFVQVDVPDPTAAAAAANGVTGKAIVTYAEDGSPIQGATVSVLIQRGLTVPDDSLPVKGTVPNFEQRAMVTNATGEVTFAASRLFTLPDHYTVVAVTNANHGHIEARTFYDVNPHP